MSQFLLVQAKHPSTGLRGINFRPVDDGLLASAASENFRSGPVGAWTVTDSSGGADTLADMARDSLLAGIPLGQTLLGRFLLEQATLGRSFCFFWADDFAALPRPASIAELLTLVADQLHTDGSSNWEIYAHWDGAHAVGVSSS